MAKAFPWKRGDTIVFEGDSLTNRRRNPAMDTWPYLELMNWKRTYADEIARLLFCWRPDLRLNFRNAGVGGSSCREVENRWERMVRPLKPNWIVMTLGGNDAARKIPVSEFETTLNRYAERAKKEFGTRMLFLGGFKAGPHMPPAKAKIYPRRLAYFAALRRVAKRHGGLYVDVGKGMQTCAVELYKQHPIHSVYSDGGHFNDVGSIIVAGELLRGLGFEWIKT